MDSNVLMWSVSYCARCHAAMDAPGVENSPYAEDKKFGRHCVSCAKILFEVPTDRGYMMMGLGPDEKSRFVALDREGRVVVSREGE
jgi:hypothetical protein